MSIQINQAWRWAIVAGASALTSLSCTQPSENSASLAPVAVPASQPLGAHWISDQRLRLVMAQLRSRNPNWPAGLPQDPESPAQGQTAQFEEVAALAAALQSAANGLPDVAGQIKMGAADRNGFLAEAQTLCDQAKALESAAGQRQIEQMQIQMDLINSTCISCHSRYRDFSGQLHPSQASAGQSERLAEWIGVRSPKS